MFGCWCVLALQVDFGRLTRVAEQRYGSQGTRAVTAWQKLIQDASSAGRIRRLVLVNDFFNRRIHYGEDPDVWQRRDYWATPLESLGIRKGDCEDFALAKYVTLLLSGVAEDRLRLIYVRAVIEGRATRAHMVVGYYPEGGKVPWILDSLAGEVLPADQRRDLTPVFSFNLQSLWVAGADFRVDDPSDRLSHWKDVILRMEDEGIGTMLSMTGKGHEP
ncbi:MAG: transglutaminase [Deltaproteobacteria bacterium]|nr:MAG: transglutaminase [Deltaproteobacteria bacterium]